MPNPTSTKPASAIYASGDSLGANLNFGIALCEGSGGAIGINNVQGGEFAGYTGSGYLGTQNGPAPQWHTNGFNSSPTLKFGWGSRDINYPTLFNTSGSTVKTLFAVFKHNLPRLPYWPAASSAVMFQIGANDTAVNGGGISIANGGVLALQHTGTPLLTGTNGLGVMYLQPNNWYAVMIVCDDTTSPKTRTFYLYDYGAQALHPLSGQGGMISAETALLSSPMTQVSINPCTAGFFLAYGAVGNNNGTVPFLGEIYCLGCLNTDATSANFNSFVADPVSWARGAYTPSGVLPPGQTPALWDCDQTHVHNRAPRAVGTGTGGSGAPTYQWYRSTTSGFTPGSGNIVTGATATEIDDSGLTANTVYYYVLQASDGSSTVTYPQIVAGTMRLADVVLGTLGDSIQRVGLDYYGVGNTSSALIARGIRARWRHCDMVNFGMPGAGSDSTTAYLSWLPSKSLTAVNAVMTLSLTPNGTPTGGTFTINVPSVGSTSSIAYNASNATIQSAIDTLIGASNVTIAGGALPGTAVTITGAAGGYQGADLSTWTVTSSLTGTGTISGTTPIASITLTTQGYPSGTSYNLYQNAKAAWVAEGVQYVQVMLGANDMTSNYSAATYGANLSAIFSDLIAAGINVIVHYPSMRTGSETAAQIALLQSYCAEIDSLCNGTTILQGDKTLFATSTIDQVPDYGDLTHPNQKTGLIKMAMAHYAGIQNVLEPPPSGGGGAAFIYSL